MPPEIHRVKHRNKGSDLDHSWVPFVEGKPLRNFTRPDGHFLSFDAAKVAIGRRMKQDPKTLNVRVVK